MEYMMFEISYNLGCDMNGKYLIQTDGNEDAIKKFIKINKKNKSIKFYKNNKYNLEDINLLKTTLKKFNNLIDSNHSDNVELYILSGILNIPGINKIYSENDLESWWIEFLECPKFPKWKNICEEVYDLTK